LAHSDLLTIANSLNKRNPQTKYPIPYFGAIYTPDVQVFRSSEATGYALLPEPFVVSCVAVAGLKKPKLVMQKGEYRLKPKDALTTMEKIRTILRVAVLYDHRHLVLSALGCGAYANPPKHIAELFRQILWEAEFEDRFDLVTFAIFDDQNSRKAHNPEGNLAPFRAVFPDASFPAAIQPLVSSFWRKSASNSNHAIPRDQALQLLLIPPLRSCRPLRHNDVSQVRSGVVHTNRYTLRNLRTKFGQHTARIADGSRAVSSIFIPRR